MDMDHQEESFNVSVEINPGLEPLTFNIIPSKDSSSLRGDEFIYKVTRDKETLSVLQRDHQHGWKQLEGKLEQKELLAIGLAIDAYEA